MTVAKKLYVGNLTYDTTEDNLVELFSEYGEVLSAQIIIDRDTNRSKGFGFVEMSDGADEAATALNGQDFRGRNLTVNEARPREDRGGGGGRGGYGGGGGGGGRGGGRGGYGGGGGGYGGGRGGGGGYGGGGGGYGGGRGGSGGGGYGSGRY
jgi:RNA recognition motif-containing protein